MRTKNGSKPTPKTTSALLPSSLVDLEDASLCQYIAYQANNFYKDTAKKLQVDAVCELVHGNNTFVRAGTGFGKTRISEMFFNLFKTKAIVLVLNPLDSLGEDQVREKELVNITAINLNKMTMNHETVQKIKKGEYSFIYLSPEVFLNSSLFTELFFSAPFQALLCLIVIDEAHMIYMWGLVVSRQSKFLVSFGRIEDRGAFRVSYGHIGTRLMATNKIPILLLSATCRPIAVESILNNLMLKPDDIKMIDGELTRPEIRLIRIPMKFTLKSADDLLSLFAPHTYTPAQDAVPTLIYSGSRNATFQVMKVVNEAQKTRWHKYDPLDQFIRRYHSCTGDGDKLENMADFTKGEFPIFSTTMALGLGQNLKRVRCVIHIGRGDPAAIGQMIGRCGRGGNPGLALLFMEPVCKKGKNTVEEFELGAYQNDDARMDALAVTKLCLQIALSVENHVGYIPIHRNNPNYLAEKLREETEKFSPCKCSNCMPDEALALVDRIKQINIHNFDSFLMDPESLEKDESLVTLTRPKKTNSTKPTCSYPPEVADHLVNHLIDEFEIFFFGIFGSSTRHKPQEFFGICESKEIVVSIDQITRTNPPDLLILEKAMGGEFVPGQVAMLGKAILNWLLGTFFQRHLHNQAEHKRFIASECLQIQNKTIAARLVAKEKAEALAHSKREDRIRVSQAKALEKQAKAKEIAEALANKRLNKRRDREEETRLRAVAKSDEKKKKKDLRIFNKQKAQENRENRAKVRKNQAEHPKVSKRNKMDEAAHDQASPSAPALSDDRQNVPL
ncbi:hypothetical protein PCANC_15871 [Puccinia coronata f. sp. avenae]|uniref:DNA 3'-5' helicase n=1 Tax=Puccinia coronata f. sp. avenae TaxID=200324 RepID=A0A2N5UPM9_9BASI|nr:hypothetical protein PCASD_25056 [Puccinia coronata f. sp. avenae]PLW39701.1 hypothetical protein PCANC_15871 [Puccinia coronata f. sp. avenae]